jgi:hypothetical protein
MRLTITTNVSDTALELVSSRGTSGGITTQTYRYAGRPRYATS